jgi:hypothetical protein
MNINFQSAQDKVNTTVDALGTQIQWLRRVVSGSESFTTGSTTTYGYGDEIVYWITGSCNAILTHEDTSDVVTNAGFYGEDIDSIQVRSDSGIEHWDQVIVPANSGIRYLILPLHEWYEGGILISKSARIRRLVPRSGSTY